MDRGLPCTTSRAHLLAVWRPAGRPGNRIDAPGLVPGLAGVICRIPMCLSYPINSTEGGGGLRPVGVRPPPPVAAMAIISNGICDPTQTQPAS